MTAEEQYFPEPDDTQEIDVRAVFSHEDQDDLLTSARVNGLLAYGLQQRITELSNRGEVVPPYLHRMSQEAAAAAEEQLARRSRVAQQEYHRTHPSAFKRLTRWLGGLAHLQG